ncbi:3-hydroxyacyl-ACP dehydratase [Streptomyces sp. NPDC050636]|uniref:3-hydroxyacyl-ACP dehydratase n=1 Tax=Streptomyces sp. NPDC050636 TaxID=3154510 RepID=UPI0034375C14
MGRMNELGFDGVPLAELGGMPAMTPPDAAVAPPDEGRAVPAPRAPLPSETGATPTALVQPTALARQMARQVQRAHASVLAAHQAISDWQTRLAASGTPAHPAPDGSLTGLAPPPPPEPAKGRPATGTTTAYEPPPGEWARLGGSAVVLRAGAAALRPDAASVRDPAAFDVTWHDAVPTGSTTLHVRTTGGPGSADTCCLVHDGDRLIASIARTAPGLSDEDFTPRQVPCFPPEFRPLAGTEIRRLSHAGLDALAAGDIAGVFGPAFDQDGLEPASLPERWPVRLLEEISVIEPGGGRYGQGLLSAYARPPAEATGDTGDTEFVPWPWLVEAVTEVLRVYAFHRGMHLCLPGARVTPLPGAPTRVELLDPSALRASTLQFTVEVAELGLFPHPFATADCEVTAAGQVVARLRDLGVTVQEAPGADIMPHPGRFSCRKASTGGWAIVNELHIAHAAEGDPGTVFAAYGARRTATQTRPRLPRGDLLMVDRCLRAETGGPGPDRTGSRLTSEYDVPADPWYCRESGGVPALALLEMTMQPMGLLGALSGMTWENPGQDFVCRNLDGRLRLVGAVDLRAVTVGQDVVLRSSSPIPGAVIQRGDFELSTGGEVFCTGDAVHGYFTSEVLERQKGLDGGGYVAPWLDRRPAASAGLRRLDLRDDTRLGHGRLSLLEDVTVVPGGGDHGAGYVLCAKPVRDDDWFFREHFLHDPVMPGSAGVQMLFQAVQAFALHTGLTNDLRQPYFALAVGEELRWSYRGQILRHHRRMRGEAHIREVRRDGNQLLILADGSVWRDDLRIYQVDNIALVARPQAMREASR